MKALRLGQRGRWHRLKFGATVAKQSSVSVPPSSSQSLPSPYDGKISVVSVIGNHDQYQEPSPSQAPAV